jgi:hypothetical protein
MLRESRERKLEKKRAAAAERKDRAASTLAPQSEDSASEMGQTVRLAVGDLVVYGNHGLGRVVARSKQEVLGRSSSSSSRGSRSPCRWI